MSEPTVPEPTPDSTAESDEQGFPDTLTIATDSATAPSRFTPHAALVLETAAAEAGALGSPTVEVGHLLLALAEVEETAAHALLHAIHLDVVRLREMLAQDVPSVGQPKGQLGAAAGAKETAESLGPSGSVVVAQAVREARAMRRLQIGPSHLLAALATTNEGKGLLAALHLDATHLARYARAIFQRAYASPGQRLWKWLTTAVIGWMFGVLVLGLLGVVSVAAGQFLQDRLHVDNGCGASLLVLTLLIVLLITTARFSLYFNKELRRRKSGFPPETDRLS